MQLGKPIAASKNALFGADSKAARVLVLMHDGQYQCVQMVTTRHALGVTGCSNTVHAVVGTKIPHIYWEAWIFSSTTRGNRQTTFNWFAKSDPSGSLAQGVIGSSRIPSYMIVVNMRRNGKMQLRSPSTLCKSWTTRQGKQYQAGVSEGRVLDDDNDLFISQLDYPISARREELAR